jgi:serine/threonine protein kinase
LTMLKEVVEAAHERGIVHGSIKVSNVLVGGTARHPSLRLTDFGMQGGDARADLVGMNAVCEDLLRARHAKQV